MFITRRRLEEIKSHERWKREGELNREREMSELWTRLRELEHKVAMLENKFNIPSTPNVTPNVIDNEQQTWGTLV